MYSIGVGRAAAMAAPLFHQKNSDSMIASDIELTSLMGGGEGGWPPHFEIRSYVTEYMHESSMVLVSQATPFAVEGPSPSYIALPPFFFFAQRVWLNCETTMVRLPQLTVGISILMSHSLVPSSLFGFPSSWWESKKRTGDEARCHTDVVNCMTL